jgi:hypothetical protein
VTPYPELPLAYNGLRAALDSGAYPAERHYLDFKAMLYQPADSGGRPKSRNEIHDELARDMASFGVRGGHLIYGVREDKENHLFIPVEMDLPAQLDQTVDQVARSRIRPRLDVAPHIISRPGQGDRGFLIIEIPESAMAPHMVHGTYYGRTETGKVPLTDDEVEEIMLRRGQVAQRLRSAMDHTRALADTAAAWPDQVSHLMLTAIPTQPIPGMFLRYTQDRAARQAFIVDVTSNLLSAILKADHPRDAEDVGFDDLLFHRRMQRVRGAWFANWEPGGRDLVGGECWLGIGDDGDVRFANLNAGSLPDGTRRNGFAALNIAERRGRPVLYERHIWWHTLDFLRLVTYLAQETGLGSSWLVGAELDQLTGRVSATRHGPGGGYDASGYVQDMRATAKQLAEHPKGFTNQLLRPLFRDLSMEKFMEHDD